MKVFYVTHPCVTTIEDVESHDMDVETFRKDFKRVGLLIQLERCTTLTAFKSLIGQKWDHDVQGMRIW